MKKVVEAEVTKSEVTKSDIAFVDPDMSFKIILVGHTGAGKTCLAKRVANDEFDDVHSVTIGGDFLNIYYYVNSKKVKLQLWDTCGLEQYRSLVRLYFKGANAALITFDLSQDTAFSTVTEWNKELRDNISEDIPTYLVGTKCDIKSKHIPEDAISNLVKTLNLTASFNTSSKTKEGLQDLFSAMLLKLYAEWENESKTKATLEQRIKVETIRKTLPKKSKKCC